MSRRKTPIDKVLLHKVFAEGRMTNYEIAEMFDIDHAQVCRLRKKYGYGKHTSITCTVCNQEKKPNCYTRHYPGVCIQCRRKLGIEKPGYGRHGNPDKVKKTTTVCLKCGRKFEVALGYKNKKTKYLCDRCTRTNGYLGEEEAGLNKATNFLMF